MKRECDARLVTVYINSTDQWHGRPLYSAILERCRQHGIAGATVIRCTEGYGAGGQLHSPRLLELSENLPVRIEIVDIAERMDPFLASLGELIGEGLVTVSHVHIIRYLHDPKK